MGNLVKDAFPTPLLRSIQVTIKEFISYLDHQICRARSKWREQGVYIASTNFASMLDYGNPDGIIMKLLSGKPERIQYDKPEPTQTDEPEPIEPDPTQNREPEPTQTDKSEPS
jgi:hypothetical protein